MKLKKDKKLRTILVGGISHDLRTPLNLIMILLNEAINNRDIPKELTEKYLTPSLHNCDDLLNLVNDILDYT